MIRIELDLYPFGSENGRENLGHIEIVNDKTGSGAKGNYRYTVVENGKKKAEGYIKDFPRQQRDVFKLLWNVLEDIYGE